MGLMARDYMNRIPEEREAEHKSGGGSLEMLRLLLGHSDYEVTRSYLHLAHQCQLLHSDVYYLNPIYFKKLS